MPSKKARASTCYSFFGATVGVFSAHHYSMQHKRCMVFKLAVTIMRIVTANLFVLPERFNVKALHRIIFRIFPSEQLNHEYLRLKISRLSIRYCGAAAAPTLPWFERAS